MSVNKIKFFLAPAIILLSFRIHAQVLETEESKPLPPGQFEIGAGLEYQTSSEGTETALPVAFEYGLTKKLTALVEPVGYTGIRPKAGIRANGPGDLEVTLFYQIRPEGGSMPSITLAGEIKIPTARNTLIGTGKTDYTPYLIASKRTGNFFTSVNLSYTFIGKPRGVAADNLFNYAVGTIFTFSPRSVLFAELYGNTSAIGGSENPEGTPAPNTNLNTAELSGGETVGAMGYGYYLKKEILLSFGVNYDNNRAFLFRPGIELKF